MRHVALIISTAAAVALLPASPTSASSSAPPPALDLGTPGVAVSSVSPQAVARPSEGSGAPVVAGYMRLSNTNVDHAFAWRSSVMLDLHTLSATADTTTPAQATGIDSKSGRVVGWSASGPCNPSCTIHAVTWSVTWGSTAQGSSVSPPTDLGGYRAQAVSPNGQFIVGSDELLRPAEWNGGVGPVPLPTNDVGGSRGVYAVNNEQIAVGLANDVPVRWVGQTMAEPLRMADSTHREGAARGVSEPDGFGTYVICGQTYVSGGSGAAAVWVAGLGSADPPAMHVVDTKEAGANLFGINPAGTKAVGWYWNGKSDVAGLWTTKDQWNTLPPFSTLNAYLGTYWSGLRIATAIDGAGDIVGSGLTKTARNARGFILTVQ